MHQTRLPAPVLHDWAAPLVQRRHRRSQAGEGWQPSLLIIAVRAAAMCSRGWRWVAAGLLSAEWSSRGWAGAAFSLCDKGLNWICGSRARSAGLLSLQHLRLQVSDQAARLAHEGQHLPLPWKMHMASE